VEIALQVLPVRSDERWIENSLPALGSISTKRGGAWARRWLAIPEGWAASVAALWCWLRLGYHIELHKTWRLHLG